MLKVTGLNVECGGRRLINDVSLSVEGGEVCAIKGNKKRCRLFMRVLSQLAKNKLEGAPSVYLGSGVSRELFGFMRVKEYCLYQLGASNLSLQEREQVAVRCLALVGFSDKMMLRRIRFISRQHCLLLALAECLLCSPKVVFLSSRGRIGSEFARAIGKVRDSGVAVIANVSRGGTARLGAEKVVRVV